MKKTIVIFSLLVIALIALFQISKYSIFLGKTSIEYVTIVIALIFLLLGIHLNKKSLQKLPKQTGEVDTKKIQDLGISKREYDVLLKVSSGYSNKEIAEQLFLSESTIKTHVSSLLVKLNAKRRTQAIQKAKEMQILN